MNRKKKAKIIVSTTQGGQVFHVHKLLNIRHYCFIAGNEDETVLQIGMELTEKRVDELVGFPGIDVEIR